MGSARLPHLGVGLMVLAAVCVTPAARAQAPGRPAVCFLSRHLPAPYGGTYLRQNLARLAGLGYRVGYHVFEDLERLPAGTLKPYEVIVLLPWPQVDYTGTKEIPAQIARDIGRDLCSPDVAILLPAQVPAVGGEAPFLDTRAASACGALPRRPALYHLRAPRSLAVPVIREGRIRLLRDVTIGADVPRPLTVCTLNAWRPGRR